MAGISPTNTQESSEDETPSRTKKNHTLNQGENISNTNQRSVLCYLLVIDEYR